MNRPSLIIRYSLICLLAAAFWGCLDKIDLEVPKGIESTFVIQGTVIMGNPSTVSINVSRLFYFTGSSVQSVNVRSVIIQDEDGNELEVPPGDQLGFYEISLRPNNLRFKFEEGKSYRLAISTFDNRNFVSSLEPILPKPTPDKLSAERFLKEIPDGMEGLIEKPFMRFRIDTPLKALDSQTRPYLRWVIDRTFQITDGSAFSSEDPKTCYITEQTNVNNIAVFDPESLASDRLDGYVIFEDLISSRYAEGQYLTVYQQSISEDVYNYWNQIRTIIERTGSMFDSPPGKIITNLENPDDPSDQAYGYFYLTQQDTIQLYVSPEMAGSPNNACPPLNEMAGPSGGCPVLVCCDCLSVEGSSTEKPKFWIQ